MRVFVLLFASAAALLTGCSPRKAPGSSASHWNLDGSEPHLVAHYMPWYEVRPPAETSWWPWSTRTPDVRTWRHWKWEDGGPVRDPEHRRADGRRDIASVQYPLIGPYDSRSREVIRYHLLTAKAAGIQAFLVDWYGPGSFEDKPMRILLDEAEDCGMKIAVCYEEKIHFPQSFGPSSRPEAVEREIKDLRYILDEYGDSAAYLTRDGLPFIMQFNSVGQSPIGAAYLNPQETRQVMEALRGRMVFARQNLDEPYHPPVPGSFHWWSPDQPEIARYTERCRNLRQAGRLQFFMSMVCPGFDDTGVWGWGQGPRKQERNGLETLKTTFKQSFEAGPELIQIVTWNDYNEGTAVEPTRGEEYSYLDAIETWWGARTGRPVDLRDNREPFRRYARDCSAAERAELPSKGLDDLLRIQPVPGW